MSQFKIRDAIEIPFFDHNKSFLRTLKIPVKDEKPIRFFIFSGRF